MKSDTNEAVVSDRVLLRQFVEEHDQHAYGILVQRYAGMVYGVCRRALDENHAKVDDATQSVFLLLARKAGSLHDRDNLSNWLYWAARNVAQYVSRTERRRRRRENQVLDNIHGETEEQPVADNAGSREKLISELDTALDGLTPPLREAVLLHHMQGLSARASAARAGCSEEAVKKRSQRGLEQMRRMLTRKGLTPSVTALAAALTAEGAASAAAVPAGLMAACEKLGGGLAGASAAASGKVVALAEATSRVMLIAKLKTVAAAVTVGLAVGVTVPMAVNTLRTHEQPPASQEEKPNGSAIVEELPPSGEAVASEYSPPPKMSLAGEQVREQMNVLPADKPPVDPGNATVELNGPVTGITGAFGDEQLYVITIAATQRLEYVCTSNGVGDCDLYVKFGSRPSVSNCTYSSRNAGNNELILVGEDSVPGCWYVLLHGKKTYSNLTLSSEVSPH